LVDTLPATALLINIPILEKYILLYARSDCSHMKFCLPHLLRYIVNFLYTSSPFTIFATVAYKFSFTGSPNNSSSSTLPCAKSYLPPLYEAPIIAGPTPLRLPFSIIARPTLLCTSQVVFMTSHFWSVAFSRAARTSFCLAWNELMNTYLSAVSTGFIRKGVVALPTLESSVKFAGVLPESEMVAVLVLRLKPRKPSSKPLRDLLERLWLYTDGTEGANQSKKAPTTRPVHVRPCPSLVFIYSLMSILP